MASFRYRAMTATGTIVAGVLDAPSQAAVIEQLRGQGHYPISTAPEGEAGFLRNLSQRFASGRRPNLRALSLATEELATLLQAGLELDRALGILTNLSEIGKLREPFAAVRARVRGGDNLADALAAAQIFPKFYVSMVRAGEMGGTLALTLRNLGSYLARTLTIRETVVSALIYPAILLASSGLSIIVILVFVLPEFEPLFANAGKSLPMATRVVMGIGDFVRGFWWAMAIVVAGLAVWYRRAMRDPGTRKKRDALLLRLPGLGKLLRAMEIERFSRTLGTLLENGVALPSALAIAKDVLWNSVLGDAVRLTAASLREGESLARLLAQSKVFPPVTLDLVQIGEETGKLGEMLLRQADLDEQRIRHLVDRLLALLVPALTLLLGVIVAGLIASMLVAILSVNDLAIQ